MTPSSSASRARVDVAVDLVAAPVRLFDPLLEPLLGDRLQVRLGGHPVGDLELRQEGLAQLELDVAERADPRRVLQRLGDVREVALHLGRRLHEEGVVAVVQALLVVDGLLLLHAHQDLVRARVALVQVVAVVGGDDADAGLLGHLQQVPVDGLLLLQPVGLHLQEEILLPEDVRELQRRVLGRLGAAAHDGLRHLAAEAGRKTDQPLGVLAQERLVDARVVIEALQVPHRVEVREVLPADLVLGQQDEVVRAPLGLVEAIGRDVGLAAEDRLHPVGLGLLIEIERAEQVAVVGDGHRLHPALEDLREEVVEADGAVEKAILRVQMQVREVGHMRRSSLALPARAIQRKRIHSLSTSRRRACALALMRRRARRQMAARGGSGAAANRRLHAHRCREHAADRAQSQRAGDADLHPDRGRPAGRRPDGLFHHHRVVDQRWRAGRHASPNRRASPEPTEASRSACAPGWPTSASRRRSGPPRPTSRSIVATGPTGTVLVAPFLAPSSSPLPPGRPSQILLYDARSCADSRSRRADRRRARMPSPWMDLSSTASFDVGEHDGGQRRRRRALSGEALVASGCVDIPGSSLLADEAVEVALPLTDWSPDPVGTYTVTSTLTFAPPLAAAATLAAPWADLSDCPLDPAQLWLDCTVDALSPATSADPLDCVPSTVPGGRRPARRRDRGFARGPADRRRRRAHWLPERARRRRGRERRRAGARASSAARRPPRSSRFRRSPPTPPPSSTASSSSPSSTIAPSGTAGNLRRHPPADDGRLRTQLAGSGGAGLARPADPAGLRDGHRQRRRSDDRQPRLHAPARHRGARRVRAAGARPPRAAGRRPVVRLGAVFAGAQTPGGTRQRLRRARRNRLSRGGPAGRLPDERLSRPASARSPRELDGAFAAADGTGLDLSLSGTAPLIEISGGQADRLGANGTGSSAGGQLVGQPAHQPGERAAHWPRSRASGTRDGAVPEPRRAAAARTARGESPARAATSLQAAAASARRPSASSAAARSVKVESSRFPAPSARSRKASASAGRCAPSSTAPNQAPSRASSAARQAADRRRQPARVGGARPLAERAVELEQQIAEPPAPLAVGDRRSRRTHLERQRRPSPPRLKTRTWPGSRARR